MPADDTRKISSHANSDLVQRLRKAEKVCRVIEDYLSLDGRRVLDLGCGAGILSRKLSEKVGETGAVISADVMDQRVVTGDWEFVLLESDALPFDAESLDAVFSNHVIEHVGDLPAQARHLAEIHRVLRPGGLAYVALPNRWAVVEPHYRLPFLSWLPRPAANAYLARARKVAEYDCYPRAAGRFMDLARAAGFAAEDVTGRILELYVRHELGGLPGAVLRPWPGAWLRGLRRLPFMPTRAFALRKPAGA